MWDPLSSRNLLTSSGSSSMTTDLTDGHASNRQTSYDTNLSSPPSHLPNHQWSYRVPSPPRVIVPPPQTNGAGFPDVHIGDGGPIDFESNGFANSEFLKIVTYADGDTTAMDSMLNWRYEERRMAQKILPFLYLGPLSIARDVAFLKREQITMIMAVRNTQAARANLLHTKAALNLGIESCTIDVAGNQELIAAFPRAIAAINTHLSHTYENQQQRNAELSSLGQPPQTSLPGRVLVFCETGNERSATVVAAYIMAMFCKDLIPAIQLVQAQRFCVSFDDSLRFLLQSYEAILRAKRDVAKSLADCTGVPGDNHPHTRRRPSSDAPAEGRMGTSSKRTLDESYDDDVDMGSADKVRDDGRFERRDEFAPFLDQ
ncbi:hypothetical protein MMC26_001566 [Xylographa opegraphella]|nr:hypothetical protein [Xylographa opegraphella]